MAVALVDRAACQFLVHLMIANQPTLAFRLHASELRLTVNLPMSPSSFTGIVPIERMIGDDQEDTALLHDMADQAKRFLTSFGWCHSIEETYFGDGIGKVVAVFLFRIIPARPHVDEWLWVVVGDIPPAYVVTDVCKTPAEALKCYISEMFRWVEFAREGRTCADVNPVNVPATPEWAENLERRLKMLETIALPQFSLPRNPRTTF
jgi:hypothetical protein